MHNDTCHIAELEMDEPLIYYIFLKFHIQGFQILVIASYWQIIARKRKQLNTRLYCHLKYPNLPSAEKM